jgi:hypothetical protein
MTNQHPITPPPDLVDQWFYEAQELDRTSSHYVPSRYYIATQAALWGADQELEACCEWFKKNTDYHISIEFLRDARRPKPPSDKEMALAALDWLSIEPCLINGVDVNAAVRAKYDTIRKALEALPND